MPQPSARSQSEGQAEALRRRDHDGILADHDIDVVIFELPAQLAGGS